MPAAPPDMYGKTPGGGTAIASSVLAVIGAVVFLGLGVLVLSSSATDAVMTGEDVAWMIAGVVVSLAVVVCLGVGGIMLFVKKKIGRPLVAAGCVLVMAAVAFAAFMTVSFGLSTERDAGARVAGTFGIIFFVIVLVAPAIVTLCLVLVAPTKEYLDFYAPRAGGEGPFGQRY